MGEAAAVSGQMLLLLVADAECDPALSERETLLYQLKLSLQSL